jgi:hypothetical protein
MDSMMMKRIQVIAVFMLSAVCSTVLADTWVYHDTLPTQVKVYVNSESIRTTQLRPEIRGVAVSLGRPGEETETITVEVMCAPQGIRTQGQAYFSATQSDKTMGKLVATVCNK